VTTINGSVVIFNTYSNDINHIIHLLIYFSHFRAYFIPINAVLGILGNVLAVLTLMTTYLRIQPTLHFVMAKCVSDSMFLTSLFVQWLRTLGYDLYESGVWCHILAMVTHATNFLSVWFIVCLAVDRFIIVYIAGSEKPICGILRHCPCGLFTARIKFKPGGQMYIPGWTVLKTIITIIGLSLLSIAVYLNISLTMGVTERANHKICTPLPAFLRVVQVLSEIDMFINILLPYSITITLIVVTCRRVLHFHTARRRTITNREFSRQHYQFYSKSQLRLTVLSAGVCSCYILLTAPTQVLRFQYSIREMLQTQHRLTIHEYFWQHVFLILNFMAFSTNFIVVLFFHKGFRKALELLLTETLYKLRVRHRTRYHGSLSPMTFAADFSSILVRINGAAVRVDGVPGAPV
jgi:hypothetical protein